MTLENQEGSVGEVEQSSGAASVEGEGGAQGTGAAKAGATEGSPTPGKEVAPPADGSSVEGATGGEEGEGGETRTFVPREKFKVMKFGEKGQQEEIVIPPSLRAIMKDEGVEKEIVSLLEKAHGIEPIKLARAEAQKERDIARGELTSITKSIQDMRTTYQRGDIDAFLKQLAIPQERMLQWALDKVNYSQLPPDQQRALDERTEAQRRAWQAEQQAGSLEQQFQEQVRATKQIQLQTSLSRPDVQSFATTFDERAGRPGAFFEEIRATGEQAWQSSNGKVDLSPDQAIEQVMQKYRGFVTPAQAAATQAAPGAVTPPAPRPATIPNIQGKNSSPVKTGPKSIADLKKISAGMGN